MLSDVRRIRALQAIANSGSFSAAAEALGYTQSAISQQLAALEAEVGLTLVERSRPPRLSDAGRLLIEEATPIFEALSNLEIHVDELRGLRAGRLRLAAFGSAFSTFLAPAVAGFRRDHPQVDLELAETLEVARSLRTGELDLAIEFDWSNAAARPDPALDRRHLLDDELLVVLPAGHGLAGRSTVPIDSLADQVWITPEPGGPAAVYWSMLERLTADAGFEPRIAYRLDNLEATRAFIAAGEGIALMNALTLPSDLGGLAVRPLADLQIHRRIWATTVAGRRWPPAAAMVELLDSAAAAWRQDRAA